MTNNERRRHPRYPIALQISLEAQGHPTQRGSSTDLSLEGIFVSLKEPLPESTPVKLVVESPDGGAPLVLSGLVVHSIGGYGNGVRLMNLSPQETEQISALITKFKKGLGAGREGE